jgi:hypothetical protein
MPWGRPGRQDSLQPGRDLDRVARIAIGPAQAGIAQGDIGRFFQLSLERCFLDGNRSNRYVGWAGTAVKPEIVRTLLSSE